MTITREPLRPFQNHTALTEELTGVSLDIETCAVCSTNRSVGDHHLVFRSHGGIAGPTVPLCVTCHNRIHDRDWDLLPEEDSLQIVERATGEIVWRLKAWPAHLQGIAGSAGDFVGMIQVVSDAMKYMPDVAPALLPWQATEVFRALRELGDSGWKAQSRLIGEMHRFRFPGRSGPEKIRALCDAFGLGRSEVYNLLAIYETFGESPLLDETPLAMSVVLEATRAKEPEKWLKVAEERTLQHPQFKRGDLRDEILLAGDRKTPVSAEPEKKMVWAKCSECGHVGWQEQLPVGNTGEPVRLEAYS